ncbi:hypothetical protein RHS03_02531, partial [Rhizoctonia solani]
MSTGSDQCRVHMDGEILDFGLRYAVYGTALLTLGLGCISMINVSRAVTREEQETASPGGIKADDEMYRNIRSHKKIVRPVSTTLNLMGVAMVGAAFIYQSNTVQSRVAPKMQQTSGSSKGGSFTLFHAYTLLSLLWLITLVGMMIHVQTWVFNVIRRRSVIDKDKMRFINSIWNGTHWYLLQVELLGVYGFYVSTNRDKFPEPLCKIPVFNEPGFRIFARVVYVIAMIPIVNVLILCGLLVGTVWVMSWVATLLRNHDSKGRTVSPMVFNFFWIFVCGIIVLAIGVTTEILLFANTDGQSVWSFGSLLALILLVVPAETFVGELYSMVVPEKVRYNFRTTLGTYSRRSSQHGSIHHVQGMVASYCFPSMITQFIVCFNSDESLSQYRPLWLSMPEPEIHASR